MHILITGACGVTSRAIVRSLKVSPLFNKSIFLGTDICENIYGIFEGLYARIYKVPLYNHPDYRKTMLSIIKKEQIEAAIVTPELEVLYWAEHPFDIPVLLPPPMFCRIAINKYKLYENLQKTGLIPKYKVLHRNELMKEDFDFFQQYPIWIRDFAEGSTSGRGAFKINHKREMEAWMTLNPDIERFLLSEYLPGKNYASHLLYHHGKLLRVANYERLAYFMGHTVMSGISGNISRGKLINDSLVRQNAQKSVEALCGITGESMHGLVTVDMRCNNNGNPMITEINIRHVAATSAFASAGCFIAQDQLLCALDQASHVTEPIETQYPENNMILRDIDGTPIWISDVPALENGECFPQ